jgi:SH3 domain-containing YSC84-like protein 1
MPPFSDQINGKRNLFGLQSNMAVIIGRSAAAMRLLSFKKGLMMITENFKARVIATAWILAMASLHGHAWAQPTGSRGGSNTRAAYDTVDGKAEAAAMKHVDDAVAVVRRIESEPGLNTLLRQAKGVFIVPNYGRVALGVGGGGGAGVLLVKRDSGAWGDPGFYNIGGISLGAQVGAQGGPIVMVLNNDKAVSSFMQKNKFSGRREAGLRSLGRRRVPPVLTWPDREGG